MSAMLTAKTGPAADIASSSVRDAAGSRWTANPAGDGPPQVPHYPSKLVREGGIRNFFPNFGIRIAGIPAVSSALSPNRRPSKPSAPG